MADAKDKGAAASSAATAASGAADSASSGSGGRRVFVGNLPYSVTRQELSDFFHDHLKTEPRHAEVMAYSDGSSKGCAIVELDSQDLAQRAITELTSIELQGRKIFVREDREDGGGGGGGRGGGARGGGAAAGGGRGRRGGRGGRGGRRSGNEESGASSAASTGWSAASSSGAPASDNDGSRLFVGNLAWKVSSDDLRHLFEAHGRVDQALVVQDRGGRSRGYGTVKFSNRDEANAAIAALHDSDHEGRKLVVRLDQKAV